MAVPFGGTPKLSGHQFYQKKKKMEERGIKRKRERERERQYTEYKFTRPRDLDPYCTCDRTVRPRLCGGVREFNYRESPLYKSGNLQPPILPMTERLLE